MSGTMKILSAALVAAALVATVAVARTVHTRAAAGDHPSISSTVGAAARPMAPLARHGIVACPTANMADCEKIEMSLPE